MRTKIVALSAAAIAFAATAIAAPMEGPWHHHDMGMEAMGMLHDANLSDAQKTQVKQIIGTAMAQNRPEMHRMHALREQMSTALLSGATEGQLSLLLKQQESLRTDLDTKQLGLEVQLRDVLTSAQLAQVAADHAKLAALHEQEHEVLHHDGE